MEIPEEYLELIQRYLAGQASDSDKAILASWLEADPERKEHFASLSVLYRTKEVLGSEQEMTSRMLARLNARIDSEEKKPTRIARKGAKVKTLWAVAASVAAAVMLGIGIHRFAADDASQTSGFTAFANTTDDVAAIMLDDSTKVWLGTKSSILYNTAADKPERVVNLSGEAYFDVRRDESRPFIVKTEAVQVKVLGTAFCVNNDTDAGIVSVILERGSVRLQTPQGAGLVRLSPDQLAEFDAKTGDLTVEPIGAEPYIVQHFDKVTLQQATIGEIISHIERMYGVRISPLPNPDGSRRYTLNYKRTDSVDDLVETVQALTGTRLKVLGDDTVD